MEAQRDLRFRRRNLRFRRNPRTHGKLGRKSHGRPWNTKKDRKDMRSYNWVAVKELKLSYHNGYI